MESELKSCPFCGGEAEYYSDCDMVKVRCSACGANTSGWWDEPEEAAAEWNRRPAPENKASSQGILDKLQKLIERAAQKLDKRCVEWKETLDRAYKDGRYNQNTGLFEADELKTSRARYTLDAYRDALSMVDTLGQQIDDYAKNAQSNAPENKPLTLEEMRDKLHGLAYKSVEWSHGEHIYVVDLSDIDNVFDDLKARKPEEDAKCIK